MALSKALDFPANPGLNGTAIVFDTGDTSTNKTRRDRTPRRLRLCIYADQIVTVTVKWSAHTSSTLRAFSTFATTASSLANQPVDILLLPGRTQITIVTTTAPTVWEGSAEIIDDQALSQ